MEFPGKYSQGFVYHNYDYTTGEENISNEEEEEEEETPPPPPPPPAGPPPPSYSPYHPTAYAYDPSADTTNLSSDAVVSFPLTTSHPTLLPSTSVPIPDRGSHPSASRTEKAMDPFEVRIRFTQQLQQLNASVTSANKAAQYAL
jgi:hypothetical protein